MTWPADFEDQPAHTLVNQQDAVTGDDDPSYTGPSGSGFHVDHHNALANAVATLQTVLGLDPAATADTVAERIEELEGPEDLKVVGPGEDVEYESIGLSGPSEFAEPESPWVGEEVESWTGFEYRGFEGNQTGITLQLFTEDEIPHGDAIAIIPAGYRPTAEITLSGYGFKTRAEQELWFEEHPEGLAEFEQIPAAQFNVMPNGEVVPEEALAWILLSPDPFASEYVAEEIELALALGDLQVTFYKDRGRVYISGFAQAAVSAVAFRQEGQRAAFILPDGYRPAQNVLIGPIPGPGASSTDQWAEVKPDGSVFPNSANPERLERTGAIPFVSDLPEVGNIVLVFDGISFRVA